MGGGRDDQRLSNVRQEAAEMRIRVSSAVHVLSGCSTVFIFSIFHPESRIRIFFIPDPRQKIQVF
jgi:hypothetical protein